MIKESDFDSVSLTKRALEVILDILNVHVLTHLKFIHAHSIYLQQLPVPVSYPNPFKNIHFYVLVMVYIFLVMIWVSPPSKSQQSAFILLAHRRPTCHIAHLSNNTGDRLLNTVVFLIICSRRQKILKSVMFSLFLCIALKYSLKIPVAVMFKMQSD